MSPFEHIAQTKESYRQKLSGSKAGLPSEALAQEGWPRKVQQALAFFIAHLFDPRLTVGWMKAQCRLNGHNFSACFRYYLGQTPKQYILHHRMAVAKSLLAWHELESISVSTIAYEVGFSSASAFAKAFKHITDATPLRWLREHEG